MYMLRFPYSIVLHQRLSERHSKKSFRTIARYREVNNGDVNEDMNKVYGNFSFLFGSVLKYVKIYLSRGQKNKY